VTPHVIRLRGFWTREDLPDGRVRHARPFGRPRTLDPGETVWFVAPAAPGDGTVTLNGDLLGAIRAGEPFAFELPPLLPRNRVHIDGPDREPTDAALEIRAGEPRGFRTLAGTPEGSA
jgi:hypothetical protein